MHKLLKLQGLLQIQGFVALLLWLEDHWSWVLAHAGKQNQWQVWRERLSFQLHLWREAVAGQYGQARWLQPRWIESLRIQLPLLLQELQTSLRYLLGWTLQGYSTQWHQCQKLAGKNLCLGQRWAFDAQVVLATEAPATRPLLDFLNPSSITRKNPPPQRSILRTDTKSRTKETGAGFLRHTACMMKLLPLASFHPGSDCAPSNPVDLTKPAAPMISTRRALASALSYDVFSSTCSASWIRFCVTSQRGDSGISSTDNARQIAGTEPAPSMRRQLRYAGNPERQKLTM